MEHYSLYFTSFELVLFTIPILPQSLYSRFAIMAIYFIGHVYKIQLYYARFKYYMLNHYVNRWDDPLNYDAIFTFTKQCIHEKSEALTTPTPTSSPSPPLITQNIHNIVHNETKPNTTLTHEVCWDELSSDSYSDNSDVFVM
jgi:hypothetical protein